MYDNLTQIHVFLQPHFHYVARFIALDIVVDLSPALAYSAQNLI